VTSTLIPWQWISRVIRAHETHRFSWGICLTSFGYFTNNKNNYVLELHWYAVLRKPYFLGSFTVVTTMILTALLGDEAMMWPKNWCDKTHGFHTFIRMSCKLKYKSQHTCKLQFRCIYKLNVWFDTHFESKEAAHVYSSMFIALFTTLATFQQVFLLLRRNTDTVSFFSPDIWTLFKFESWCIGVTKGEARILAPDTVSEFLLLAAVLCGAVAVGDAWMVGLCCLTTSGTCNGEGPIFSVSCDSRIAWICAQA
jgi:hypothetical protein